MHDMRSVRGYWEPRTVPGTTIYYTWYVCTARMFRTYSLRVSRMHLLHRNFENLEASLNTISQISSR